MAAGVLPAWNPDTATTSSRLATSVAELLDYKDPKSGLTPLMIAVQNGHEPIVQQVLHASSIVRV